MKVTGHCHCGKIGFEAEIDPAQSRQIWVRSALPWSLELTGLPRADRQQ